MTSVIGWSPFICSHLHRTPLIYATSCCLADAISSGGIDAASSLDSAVSRCAHRPLTIVRAASTDGIEEAWIGRADAPEPNANRSGTQPVTANAQRPIVAATRRTSSNMVRDLLPSGKAAQLIDSRSIGTLRRNAAIPPNEGDAVDLRIRRDQFA